jgi:hypothetical protein
LHITRKEEADDGRQQNDWGGDVIYILKVTRKISFSSVDFSLSADHEILHYDSNISHTVPVQIYFRDISDTVNTNKI